MPRTPRSAGGRSYDHYCAVARALDLVGDRWTLLIVRELLAGPRRYTDLHADLPGVSTDVLASRLKDMERDGLSTRRRLPPPGAVHVYELTARGREACGGRPSWASGGPRTRCGRTGSRCRCCVLWRVPRGRGSSKCGWTKG